MKKKIVISFVIIFSIFSIIVSNNVFAIDDFMNSVLTQMDSTGAGLTTETQFTKAISQIIVIGGMIGYMTWHSMQFFANDATTRQKAKEALPWRVLAIVIILALDGIVTIVAKYFTP